MPDGERRRQDGFVTHAELREAVDAIHDRYQRVDKALAFYELMVPLGLEELLPTILRNARVAQVLNGLRGGRRRRWLFAFSALGAFYVAVTLIGGTMAILRTAGILR